MAPVLATPLYHPHLHCCILLQLLTEEEIEKVHNRAKDKITQQTVKMLEVWVKYNM